MADDPRTGAGAVPGAVPETFVFTCRDCGYVWQAVFQVVFFTDPTSLDTQEYVDEAGRPVRSPLADAVCPFCHGRHVHVTTPELAGRAEPRRADRHGHRFHLRHRRPGRPGKGTGSA
ncbi:MULTISPECIES: hypothetical protein [Streptomyces]|uniref:hypothetical protein n=1 Tax=Streptomyces TaxID=1883 RepID=UPI0029319EF4|nr:hypothetical protein [Streptomyces sp. NEAU-HV9]